MPPVLTLPGHDAPVRVGKILGIGKNYAKHAAEMKGSVPSEPVVFLKPATALVRHGGAVVLPPQSADVHHELELVAVIGTGGRDLDEATALGHVAAYALGLDMTARDVQQRAKDAGRPWSVAKGFDTFAPLGPLAAAADVPDPQALTLRLAVNGAVRQTAHTRDMVFPLAHLVAYCSRIFTLEPGDLLYTGTPEGVGPVADGDALAAEDEAGVLPPLRVRVTRPTPPDEDAA
jgi:2-keto-4-pentenoate hydratase/2-oxohepta-3-ene-1,7-dioic acid hydratase in catechol pathway